RRSASCATTPTPNSSAATWNDARRTSPREPPRGRPVRARRARPPSAGGAAGGVGLAEGSRVVLVAHGAELVAGGGGGLRVLGRVQVQPGGRRPRRRGVLVEASPGGAERPGGLPGGAQRRV